MNKWHYQIHGHSTGPVSPEELRREIAAGRVTGRTPVWHEALPDWIPLSESELAELLTEPLDESCIAGAITLLFRLFRVYWLLVFLCIITFLVGLSMIASMLSNYRVNNELSDGWLAASISVSGAAILLGLSAVVVWLVIIYQGWKAIPPECAETTPGRAAGLLCIPMFNWYWNFVAIAGLSKALNAQLQRDGIRTAPVSEALCKTYCVLRTLDIFAVFTPVALLLGLLLPGQLCRGASAIWQNRLRERLADAQAAAAKQEKLPTEEGEK